MSEEEQQEGFELKAFGASMTIRGKDVLPIIKFVAIWSCVGFALYTFHSDHKEMGDTMKVMTYVISLPQDERVSLRLNMPDSLRERLGK